MKGSNDLPRRKISELVTLYELEPDLRDVFTEGESDKAIVRWFIDENFEDCINVGVYAIDQVEVTREVLALHGYTPSNRFEVISLCLELEKNFGASCSHAIGIIDKDAYSFLNEKCECRLVLETDYSSIEMYLFSEKNLGKALRLSFPRVTDSAKVVIDRLIPVLSELFLIRTANQSLRLGVPWKEFERFVSFEGGNPIFRQTDFIRHYLQAGGKGNHRDKINAEIEKLRERLSGDHRNECNGHDAVSLLSEFLKTVYRKAADQERTRPHILSHILTCSLDVVELRDEKMFADLLQRLAA